MEVQWDENENLEEIWEGREEGRKLFAGGSHAKR